MNTPRYFIAHREDVPLRMKVLPHADLSQVDDGHNAHIEGQNRLPPLVARDGRDAVALCGDSVCLETFWLRVSLDIRGTRVGRGRRPQRHLHLRLRPRRGPVLVRGREALRRDGAVVLLRREVRRERIRASAYMTMWSACELSARMRCGRYRRRTRRPFTRVLRRLEAQASAAARDREGGRWGTTWGCSWWRRVVGGGGGVCQRGANVLALGRRTSS